MSTEIFLRGVQQVVLVLSIDKAWWVAFSILDHLIMIETRPTSRGFQSPEIILFGNQLKIGYLKNARHESLIL
jgi:hypothetical protein